MKAPRLSQVVAVVEGPPFDAQKVCGSYRGAWQRSAVRTKRILQQTRVGGPRCGDPTIGQWHFIPAKSVIPLSAAPSFAKSPCRGAARRCAAAFGLESAQELQDRMSRAQSPRSLGAA